MRVCLKNAAAVLLALCFPWLSAASGAMTLCVGADGRVGFGPYSELACAAVEGLVAAEHTAGIPCAECLDAAGCVHIPGKGLLHRPPTAAAQKRSPSGQAFPYALTMAQADSGMPSAPCVLPSHVLDGQHGMRLRLAELNTVVLRL